MLGVEFDGFVEGHDGSRKCTEDARRRRERDRERGRAVVWEKKKKKKKRRERGLKMASLKPRLGIAFSGRRVNTPDSGALIAVLGCGKGG